MSFAGEHRDYVERIVRACERLGLRVFGAAEFSKYQELQVTLTSMIQGVGVVGC